jgi:hypothetical protein
VPDPTRRLEADCDGGLDHRLYLGEAILTSLTDARQTDGQFTVMEYVGRASARAPLLHVHEREDETFYVIEGVIVFHFLEQKIMAPAGTAVFLPRGVPHDALVPLGLARALVLFVPGGIEEYFQAVGPSLPSPTFPEATAGRFDVEDVRAIAASYGLEFLRLWPRERGDATGSATAPTTTSRPSAIVSETTETPSRSSPSASPS